MRSFEEQIAGQIKSLWAAVVILAVGFVLALGGATWAVISGGDTSARVSRNQQKSTQALCAFRDDLQRRVTTGNAYLIAHPNGFAGISAATIRVSLMNEQATLTALSPLDCPH